MRCFGDGDPLYEKYHDEEWGKAEHDDQKLFEMLSLEGAQAGLSWITILRKREGYREAFHHFDVAMVAKMRDAELDAIIEKGNVVRNRLKIYSVRHNAHIFMAIQKEFGSFDRYFWGEWTPESLSKDLKKRGMKFVGPLVIESLMQAAGLIDGHSPNCTVAR